MTETIKDGLQNTDTEIRSFLMIGQSNMAGRGRIGEVEPIINDNCFMVRNGRFQSMREPINVDRPVFDGLFRSGVGLAASFADCLQKDTGLKIGLIPCADGGTKIEQWLPGEILFDNAVAVTKTAMRSSKFSGIIWHQGESNSKVETDFDEYGNKVIQVMTELRRLLGDVPIVLGEISREIDVVRYHFDYPAGIDRINEQIHRVAGILPNCAVASSEGIALQDDGIHFSAAACRTFGERYFEAFKTLKSDF